MTIRHSLSVRASLVIGILALCPVEMFQLARLPTHTRGLAIRHASKKKEKPERVPPKESLSEALEMRRIRFTDDVSKRFNISIVMPDLKLPLGFLGGVAAGCALTVALSVVPMPYDGAIVEAGLSRKGGDDGGLRESVQLFDRVLTQLDEE
jgi:hypothetical protein